MIVAYDGTDFFGWQCQLNKRTVQSEIENALFAVTGEKIRITASGRTDSGVHAAGQVCHFDCDSTIPAEKFSACLNRILPSDVKILSSTRVDDAFDCNRNAKKKTYCYCLYVANVQHPLKERYSVKYPVFPDLKKMRAAAKIFEGTHDFKAFCASGSSVKTTVRTIYEIRIEQTSSFLSDDIKIYVTGNGFLYNMVRSMVGELLAIASGKKTIEELEQVLSNGDRQLIGRTMPAKGLTLLEVNY